jgi:hypothetical protein
MAVKGEHFQILYRNLYFKALISSERKSFKKLFFYDDEYICIWLPHLQLCSFGEINELMKALTLIFKLRRHQSSQRDLSNVQVF